MSWPLYNLVCKHKRALHSSHHVLNWFGILKIFLKIQHQPEKIWKEVAIYIAKDKVRLKCGLITTQTRFVHIIHLSIFLHTYKQKCSCEGLQWKLCTQICTFKEKVRYTENCVHKHAHLRRKTVSNHTKWLKE